MSQLCQELFLNPDSPTSIFGVSGIGVLCATYLDLKLLGKGVRDFSMQGCYIPTKYSSQNRIGELNLFYVSECTCLYVCIPYVGIVLKKSEKCIRSSGNGVKGGGEPAC